MTNLILILICLLTNPSGVFSFLTKHVFCNQTIDIPSLDFTISSPQNSTIQICHRTFNVVLHSNEHFFSRNLSMDRIFRTQNRRRFAYLGHVVEDESSSVSLILYPHLHIYIYLNGTYFYYLSTLENNSLSLKFSQQQLLQYYPTLVNDSLWTALQQEEEIFQKNSLILHDLHFIYEFLTMRCEGDHLQDKLMSFCSLALYIDQILYEKVFFSDVYYIFNYLEHFNFLLRTLSGKEYGGFLLKRLTLIQHVPNNANVSFDLLHQLSNNISLPLKDFCLNHQMMFSDVEKETFIVGYQSSIHTYDIGGICSSPFYINVNNRSEEINLNTGLSIFNEQLTRNLSSHFIGLMKTSYLFLRQMGLNLTLCSINSTRRGFFQFNTNISPAVANCLDLIPVTLRPALKRRAHLCFNHLNLNNLSHLPVKQQVTCKQSLDLQSSVPMENKYRKSPYIENALNNNRRDEWFEGNIVGMILSFSLLIWIPVSCFVHFCIDEINKKALIEKQQQQQQQQIGETSPMKPAATSTVEQIDMTKETQTD